MNVAITSNARLGIEGDIIGIRILLYKGWGVPHT